MLAKPSTGGQPRVRGQGARAQRVLTVPHHVVIVGGGFGGLAAAQALRRANVQVTVVDRRNHHLFQPLLYQVATGGLSPANIAKPLRAILARQKNARVVLAEVTGIEPDTNILQLADGELQYDTLLLAAGAHHHYFGNDHFANCAPGLKSLDDATSIRRRILTAFETAERNKDQRSIDAWLTFVVVGGGPTGVEMAGAIAELANDTLRHEFRHIDTTAARILLVEGAERILPAYPQKLSRKAAQSLDRLGVEVRTGTLLADVTESQVTLRSGETVDDMRCHCVVWAAGVQGVSLAQRIADSTGAATDRMGRLIVQADCRLPGTDNIYAIGDMVCYGHDRQQSLPGVAPVAVQQGKYVASEIVRRIKGQPSRAFRYRDRGQMATIGRAAAVAEIAGLRFSGYPAWLIWLFVHLMMLVGFENRLLVFTQWCWNYITRNRAARLITHSDAVLVDTLDRESDHG